MSRVGKELPKGWAIANLGDIVDRMQYGFTTKSSPDLKEPKVLRITDIREDGVDWNAVPGCNISEDDLAKYRLADGDMVFARSGSIEKAFRVSNPPEAVFASYLIRGRPIEKSMGYLLEHFVKTRDYLNQIGAFGSGIAIQNVNAKKLSSIKIPIPPLNEQKRIVARIDQLQSHSHRAREALETVPDLLEQLRQSLLAAAFRGDLTEEWRKKNPDVEPATDLLKRIRAERRKRWEEAELQKLKTKGLTGEKLNEEFSKRRKQYKEPALVDTADLPALPKNWYWCLLPEVGYMNRGKSRHRPRNAPHLYGGKYPFIQTGDIAQSKGRITSHHQTYSEAGLAQSKLWPAGTVCITIAANIASSAILTYPACFPDSVVGIITDNDLCPPEYVEFFIRTARSELEQFAPATAQKNINIGILNNVVIPLAPRKEVDEILRLLKLSFANVEASEFQLNLSQSKLAEFEQAVLSKAFRGELVPQDPNDEPASVLLKRIAIEKENTLRLTKKSRFYKLEGSEKKVKRTRLKRSLIEVMQEYPKGITPEELLTAGGYKIDEVDAFYEQLSKISSHIEEEKPSGPAALKWPLKSKVILRLKRR